MLQSMGAYPLASGVRLSDCLFSEPMPVRAWRAPGCLGIVAILVRNPLWGPRPLQPLYFGESAGLRPNMQREDLLVAELPMPYSTASQRRALCHELNASYRVISTAELASKVDDLENRQQEQSRQILSLLTFIEKLFAPQPVGPRKPIGFRPVPTESGS